MESVLGGCDSKALTMAIGIAVVIALILFTFYLWGLVKKEGVNFKPFTPDTKDYEKYTQTKEVSSPDLMKMLYPQ
jgi:hypothetical protein